MKLKDSLELSLRDTKFKAEYNNHDLAFEIGEMVYKTRLIKGYTQSKLAEIVETKQPSIARLENGSYLPSLSFLERIAKALGTYLIAPRFAVIDEYEFKVNTSTKFFSFKEINSHYLTKKTESEWVASKSFSYQSLPINFLI